jgi:hypothetical protein
MKIMYSCWKLLVAILILMVIFHRVSPLDLTANIIEGSPYAPLGDW